jgi:hypothetical protein
MADFGILSGLHHCLPMPAQAAMQAVCHSPVPAQVMYMRDLDELTHKHFLDFGRVLASTCC